MYWSYNRSEGTEGFVGFMDLYNSREKVNWRRSWWSSYMWLGTLFYHQYNVKRNSGRRLPPVKMGELRSRSKTTCHPALVGWLLSQKKAWDGLLHTLYKGCLLLIISTSPHSPVKKFGVQHGFRTVGKPAREIITKTWWNRVQKSLVWLHHDICYCQRYLWFHGCNVGCNSCLRI